MAFSSLASAPEVTRTHTWLLDRGLARAQRVAPNKWQANMRIELTAQEIDRRFEWHPRAIVVECGPLACPAAASARSVTGYRRRGHGWGSSSCHC